MSGSNALAFGVPTIASSGAPQVANPLAAIAAGNQAAASLYDLRAKQAQEAAGQAYQGAINPQTGELDANEFRRRLAASGPAAMAAGASLANIQSISSDQLNQMKAKAGYISHNAGVLADMPNPTQQDAIGVLHKALTDGMLTPAEFQRQVANLPTDAAGLQNWAAQHRANAQTVQQQIEWRYGVPFQQTGPGGQTIGGTRDVRTGAISGPPQPGLPQGLTPEDYQAHQRWLTESVTYPDPADPSKQKTAPRATQFRDFGIDPSQVMPGALQRSTTPASPNVSPSPNASPNKPASASPNKPFGTGTGVTAPSQADLDTQAAGVKMGTALTTRAEQVAANRANFGTMLADADKLDSMGPTTERQNYLNSLSQKYLGTGLLGNATEDQIARADSFAKVANLMAGSQMASLGASDARQQLAIGSNPHLDLSKLGNTRIIHMLQGNEDAIEAKSRAWQDWTKTHPSGSYGAFQDDFNRHFDVRVFHQQYMDDSELDSLKRQLQSQKKDTKFLQDVDYARERGWIRK